MNPSSQKEALDLFDKIKNGVRDAEAEIVVCPPFLYLKSLGDVRHPAELGGMSDILLGAQNCFWEEKGAFTGEISAAMLKNLDMKYVIIGHSERRKYFGETDGIINKKIKAAMAAEVEQIFCVGETEKERSDGSEEEVLERQIKKGLEGVDNILGMAIAYEPVWAIGTGRACGTNDAKKMNQFVEKVISEIYGEDVSKQVRILYGGSVNSQNSESYLKEAGYNGLLVGRASLNAEEFAKIVKSATM